MDNIEIMNGAIDEAKDNPNIWEAEIGWAWENYPKNFDLVKCEIQNQNIKRNPSTARACGMFSGSHMVNNAVWYELTRWETLRNIALYYWAKLVGWMTNMLVMKILLDKKYISWYVKVQKNINAIKNALMIYWPLQTWTTYINWNLTKFWANLSWWVWHFVVITGWDDSLQAFKLTSSFWPSRADKWSFWLKYKDIDKLFTILAPIIDSVQAQKKREIEQQKIIDNLKNLGYTDWNNLDQIMTRQQASTLLARIKLKNKNIDLNAWTIWGIENKIFDWTRLTEGVKKYELGIMISRILKSSEKIIDSRIWSWNNWEKIASRFEGLLMIWRANKILNW